MDEKFLYNEIGKKIQFERKKLGITQEKLAELTNYSPSFIANIESNTYQAFSLSALNNIAKVLNINIANLLPSNQLINNRPFKLSCQHCKYEAKIPEELIKLLVTVHEINKKPVHLTCPLCHKKISY